MSEAILVENFKEIIVVRFNRPQERNPLSVFVLEKLHSILETINPPTKTVIFTGCDDVFAAGADLREIARVNEDTAREFAMRGQNLMREISELEQTTIAAVNGFCFGGALDLALACDYRIAAPNALFSHPGANLGIITGWGGTQRLPRLIGEAKALEMFLTTKRVSSDEALRTGLIDEIAENPLARALNFSD